MVIPTNLQTKREEVSSWSLQKTLLVEWFRMVCKAPGSRYFSPLKSRKEFVIETSKTLFSNLKQQNAAVALFITLACCVIGNILLKIFVRQLYFSYCKIEPKFNSIWNWDPGISFSATKQFKHSVNNHSLDSLLILPRKL